MVEEEGDDGVGGDHIGSKEGSLHCEDGGGR